MPSKAKTITAVGIMTGTSCDGADLAALALSFDERRRITQESLITCASVPFSMGLRRRLLSAQGGQISLSEYGALCRDYSLWISERCAHFVKDQGLKPRSTVLGVHGQTLWHEPPARSPSYQKPGFSIQMVDACLIAQRTGLLTVSQFRQPDLALGGQGAPLVPYYHWLKTRSAVLGVKPPLVIHNIGGISNLTYVSAQRDEILAFDTGPGNALIDLAVAEATAGRKSFDDRGALARTGHVDWALVRRLARHPYFSKRPPKSTGREMFNKDFLARFRMKGPDLVANATAFTALTMAWAYRDHVLGRGRRLNAIFVAGGGAKNAYLVMLFRRMLVDACRGFSVPVKMIPESVAPSQSLEAMAFARLAGEAVLGHSVSLKSVTGAQAEGVGAALFQAANYCEVMKLVNVSY